MDPESEKKPEGPPKTGVNQAVIIIIIIASVLVLAAGGYLVWKYLKGKVSIPGTARPTASATVNASVFTLTKLEDMLKYPNGTLVSTDRSKSAGYASALSMQTNDSVAAANNYYLSLNSDNKWTVTSKALEPDNSRADITLEGIKDKFTVNIIIDNYYERTDILARIDAEDLPVGTPLSVSATVTPSVTASASPSATATATPTGQTTITEDYIIADSNTRVVAVSELTALNPWQLKVARNEIYARHGRPFVHKDLQCYFATKSWYTIDTNFTEAVLSVVENKNIATIQAYEQKTNSPLQSFDSGCKK